MRITPHVRTTAEQIHDALDAADDGFHDRDTGVVDTTSDQLAAALLKAGWQPPSTEAPLAVGDVLHGYCGGAFTRESYRDKTVEAVGPDWVVVRTDMGEVEFSAGEVDRLREYR